MNKNEARTIIQNCTILNCYEGRDTFSLYAEQNPEDALLLIWNLLTEQADPGKDEGPLCYYLLMLAANTSGRDAI